MNIALTGFMGTGKTVVGRVLAERLGWEFVDVDAAIEQNAEMSVADIFARFGENGFRDRETQAIKKLSALDHKVFSCGGGAVLRAENMDLLEKSGIVVCLTAAPEVIFARLKGNTTRPLLRVPDPLAKIRDMLVQRAPFYRRCSLTVATDNLTPALISDRILRALDGAGGVR